MTSTHLKMLASTTLAALTLTGCKSNKPIIDRDALPKICKEYCNQQRGKPDVIMLVQKSADAQGRLTDMPNDNIYVRTPDGFLQAPNKAEGLNPECFSTTDFAADFEAAPEQSAVNKYPRDEKYMERLGDEMGRTLPDGYRVNYTGKRPEGSLWAKDLTWDNTTITFINFDKDGRLESRILTEPTSTKAGKVMNDLDHLLDAGNTSSPINEYQAVQHVLMLLEQSQANRRRPRSDLINTEGFQPRNLGNVPIEKTPFFTKLDYTTGAYKSPSHTFFYVLLDDHLRFNRVAAAMIPYAPRAATDIGSLYTPYIQHPIVPSDPLTSSEKADVMTVQFVRGGTMAEGLPEDAVCNYPYDIGVIAESQAGFEHVTPLMIDPEVEAEGVMP